MQVKVFESPDMATGLKMVRNELGADALILSTRSVRNPKLGLLGKSMLEITAAIDGSTPALKSNVGITTPGRGSNSSTPGYFNRGRQADTANQTPQDNLFSLFPSRQPVPVREPDTAQEDKRQDTSSHYVNRELDELKLMIRSLSREVASLKPYAVGKVETEETAVKKIEDVHVPPVERQYFDKLKRCGIANETATVMSDLAAKSLPSDDLSDESKLSTFFQEIAAGFLHVSPPLLSGLTDQKRIALVGPTGVGKTTTIAKIAAKCIGTYHKSVALITIDTYRIAAVEQLKVYGEIMGLPVEVVLTPGQFKNALEQHRDKDVILIDTAGRSPKDTISIEELAGFLTDELDIEKHLVLSAGTRDEESIEAVSHFQKLNLDRTIFTKIDECSNLGVILNTQLNNPNPLSFITNGQRVPEDILDIDGESVARLVIPTMQGTIS